MNNYDDNIDDWDNLTDDELYKEYENELMRDEFDLDYWFDDDNDNDNDNDE